MKPIEMATLPIERISNKKCLKDTRSLLSRTPKAITIQGARLKTNTSSSEKTMMALKTS